MAKHKKNWIDYNAGQLLEDKLMSEMNEELWQQLIALASGEHMTNNERNGFREIAIFKDGVTL
ncbi:Altronate dehydratase [compost metagenome]